MSEWEFKSTYHANEKRWQVENKRQAWMKVSSRTRLLEIMNVYIEKWAMECWLSQHVATEPTEMVTVTYL